MPELDALWRQWAGEAGRRSETAAKLRAQGSRREARMNDLEATVLIRCSFELRAALASQRLDTGQR